MTARAFPKRFFAFIPTLLLVFLPPLPAQSTGWYFTHVAGPKGGPGNADGPADIARFAGPVALAIDAAGNVYVADAINRAIRKVSNQGVVSTIGRVFQPSGLAIDATGTLYVADASAQTIYKMSQTGELTVFAGANYQPFYGPKGTLFGINADGVGANARFFQPGGLALDAAGNLYVADSGNNTVRKITPAGVVSTIAGSTTAGNADGVGSAASFTRPLSVGVDQAGNVYVSDVRTIRRITPDGTVTTLAGNGTTTGDADGVGSAAKFSSPRLVVTPAGTVYAADYYNHTIRQISATGVVTTIAGAAGQTGFTDGNGAAARFNRPMGLVLDAGGDLIVADSENDFLRRVTPAGQVSTFAGRGGNSGATNGPADSALFNQPCGVAMDATGNLYIADMGNHLVRKITPTGEVSTFSGTPGVFRQPNGVAISPAGVIYSADAGKDRIAIHSTDGIATTLVGGSPGFADGPVATARLHWPLGLAIGRNGTIYVADTANKRIRKITTDGTVSTLSAEVEAPNGVAVDDADNVYVADRSLSAVLKISPAGTTSILAGSPGQSGTVDGQGSAARFNGPCGVAVDRQGNVFVAETDGNVIRRITPDGTVTTIGGNPGIYGSADGIGAGAHFFAPHGIAVGNDGSIYVTEEWNHAVRKGQPASSPVITAQPRSQTVTPGSAVQLSVSVTAVPDVTYQWYFNGQPFAGATSRTLSLNNVRTSDAGAYTVVVTNALGSVTSAAATLQVSDTPPPATPGSGNTGTGEGGGGGGAPSVGFLLALLVLGAARARAARG